MTLHPEGAEIASLMCGIVYLCVCLSKGSSRATGPGSVLPAAAVSVPALQSSSVYPIHTCTCPADGGEAQSCRA